MMSFQEKLDGASRLMEKHGLKDWRLSIENLANPNIFRNADGTACVGTMGFCANKARTIYIDSGLPDRHFRQTLLHEIAHALTPGDCGHGWEWINKAGEIGCTFSHYFPYAHALKRAEKSAGSGAVRG
jgi:hypothetical protein